MNCANHPDIAAAAYCRTCGKPLCPNCTRDVRGVIYCENCLAERLQGVQPAAAVPGVVPAAPREATAGGGPNPALAGILAGFFPFGVGAVYTGQYAKGLAHLITFTLLVWGESVVDNAGLNTILGLGIAFFYVYQIIDSVRTAHAVQAGEPAPDPLGLAQAFGAGEKVDSSKVPTAAVVLIGLGILFLLQTVGIFAFDSDRLWPIFLIGLGVWLMSVRLGWIGSRKAGRPYGRHTMIGPVVLITIGVLQLMEKFNGPRWHQTWPLLLLAIGATQLIQSRTPLPPPPVPGGPGTTGAASGEVQPPSSGVHNG